MQYRIFSPARWLLALSVTCLLWMIAVAPALAQPASDANAHRMADKQIVEDLRATLDRQTAADRFSGTALVAKNGQVLFEHAYGYADHAFNVPNKVDTKFNLGSIGKMFTGVSVLQLAQQGKFSLDDKLAKVLPDYPNQEIANRITLRQLLTHEAGLADFFGPEFMASSMEKFDTLESLVPLFVNKPLQFEPGTKWSYCNSCFIVLGLVIQHVSGESYYDYVREHIFKPAGMINTDNLPWDAVVPNRAMGYTAAGLPPGSPRRSNVFTLQRGGPAGGGYSTVEDMLRFAQALQGHKLLNKTYTDMAMKGEVETTHPGVKDALGMFEEFPNGVRIVGHSGGGPGTSSNLDMYPDLGYVAVILSNYDGGASLNEKLRLELTGSSVPRAVQVSADVLKSFAATYAPVPPPNAPPGMRMPPMQISADSQGLWLDVGMGGSHRFLPLSADEFFDEETPGARLRFTKGQQGQITGLTLTGAGPGPMQATKQP
jgi:CubicO group peptidase (beta-lactamase class C family)